MRLGTFWHEKVLWGAGGYFWASAGTLWAHTITFGIAVFLARADSSEREQVLLGVRVLWSVLRNFWVHAGT